MANPEKRFLQNLTHSGVVLGGVNALGPYSSMFFFACSVVKPLSKFVENRSHSSDASTTWTSNSSSCLRSSNFSVGNKDRINFLRRSDFNDTKKMTLTFPFPFLLFHHCAGDSISFAKENDFFAWKMAEECKMEASTKTSFSWAASPPGSSGAVAGTEKRALSFHKCCASPRRAENR